MIDAKFEVVVDPLEIDKLRALHILQADIFFNTILQIPVLVGDCASWIAGLSCSYSSIDVVVQCLIPSFFQRPTHSIPCFPKTIHFHWFLELHDENFNKYLQKIGVFYRNNLQASADRSRPMVMYYWNRSENVFVKCLISERSE